MIGTRIPRFLLYATALGIVVAGIMLSMFYGQYRWLANQIVSTSSDEHRTLLEASFERRMRADLHTIADILPEDSTGNENAILDTLSRAVVANPELTSIRFTNSAGASW